MQHDWDYYASQQKQALTENVWKQPSFAVWKEVEKDKACLKLQFYETFDQISDLLIKNC